MVKQIEQIQQTNTIQRAQDEVFFWLRMEMQLIESTANHPNDDELKKKLWNATEKRKKAEDRLKALEIK